MQIKVINLERSHDRLASFRTGNPHLPWIERWPAVEGRALDRTVLIRDGWLSPDVHYTTGALGNALSHLQLWEQAATGGEPLTVLEDDAVLCANFVEEASRIIGALAPGWDYVQWGYNFDTVLAYDLMPGLSPSVALFDQARMRLGLPDFHRRSVLTSTFPLIRSLGIPGYTVSPSGAAKLRQFCRPIRPLAVRFPLLGVRPNYSIDFMMNAAYEAIAAYVAVPALVLTANLSSASTVQDINDPYGPAQVFTDI